MTPAVYFSLIDYSCMFIDKIKAGDSGILTYGITPPKSGTDAPRVAAIAQRTIERLIPLEMDALIVYDVQDESDRTARERPFPFLNALDPFSFARDHLQALQVPKIIYRPAGKFTKEELSTWLDELQKQAFYPVFVGVPSPNHPVKTTLPEAYHLCNRHRANSVIGAVAIPERHAKLNDEDKRILSKADCGVSYFITQCVFDMAYAKKMVEDLCHTCKQENKRKPTIIFTLTACGSVKTLQFMEWLGIHIPAATKTQLTGAGYMLQESVSICLNIASALTKFCKQLHIPFGFNIESVAIRKDEIEASIGLFNSVSKMLEAEGVRSKDKISPAPPADSLLGVFYNKVMSANDQRTRWEVFEVYK